MIGIYLSGTGNAKHCAETLISLSGASTQCFLVEYAGVENITAEHDNLVLGCPTQLSNAPFVVRDLIDKRRSLWNGKAAFIFSTMGLFSDDGTGRTARLLRKYGTTVPGGLQIRMPDSARDSRLLRKNMEEDRRIAREAGKRIAFAAGQI